jgi:uncharacterized membrane protein
VAADVVVRFLADTAQLDQATRQIEGTGDRLRSVGRTIAGAIGGAAVIGALASATKAASSLNETVSKSDAIFGKSAKSIEKWAEGAADGFGQSKQQALEAAATFGNMFDQLGTGEADTVRMSKRMVELASDFASFHDADITQVLEAQTAAFRGEYDALQKFVPTINAAAVETKALAMTGKENAKELTAQEKAAATYRLMIEGAGKAVGDFDRTSESAANQQRKFQAQMADLQATVGQALLPVLVQVLGVLSDVASLFQRLPAPVQTAIVALGLFAAASAAIASLHLIETAKSIGSGFKTVAEGIASATTGIVNFARTAAVAIVTNPILLAVTAIAAAFTALAFWSAFSKSATEKATEAGKEFGKTLVENARAASDLAVTLDTLRGQNGSLRAQIADTTDVLELYQKVAHDNYLAQTQFGMSSGQAAAHVAELESRLARLKGTQEVVRDEIQKIKREQELAAIADDARRDALKGVAAATDITTQATEEGIRALQAYSNQVLAAQGGWIGYEAAQLQVQQAEENLQRVLADPEHTALQAAQAANQLESAKLGAASAAVDATAKEQAFTSTLNQNAIPGLTAMRAALVETQKKHGDNTGAIQTEIEKIDQYIWTAGGIPPQKTTKAHFDADAASSRMADYARQLDQLPETVRTEAILAIQQGTIGYALPQAGAGGIVPGPRGSPQLLIAHGGETVLPTHTMGAEAAIAQVLGGGSSTFNITVNVPLGASAAQVGAATVDAIRAYERQNGRSWRS